MTRLGLRIDVDTRRGCLAGVPALLAILHRHRVRASFFFSVGPDNMGRHLWRLLHPAFAAKMARSRAASLYGWDILLAGTLWPGRNIGRAGGAVIRATARAGHEVGLHAWDHHGWQAGAGRWDEARYRAEICRGRDGLARILGRPVVAAAAPAWRITDSGLAARGRFGGAYNSDCRGDTIFRPLIENIPCGPVQVPTTLPTYDEVVGRECDREAYNHWLLDRIRPERLNVLTVHAEVEGGVCRDLFQAFLAAATERGIRCTTLGELATRARSRPIPALAVRRGTVPGRQGWLAVATAAEDTGGSP